MSEDTLRRCTMCQSGADLTWYPFCSYECQRENDRDTDDRESEWYCECSTCLWGDDE